MKINTVRKTVESLTFFHDSLFHLQQSYINLSNSTAQPGSETTTSSSSFQGSGKALRSFTHYPVTHFAGLVRKAKAIA